MAELLIKAVEPWNNDDPKAPENRTRKGDIIVVRPDGWKWGREECLPRFIVVKVKESYEEAKKYEDSLTEQYEETVEGKTETMERTLRVRKHNIDISAVDSISDEVKDFEEITPVELKATIRVKNGFATS